MKIIEPGHIYELHHIDGDGHETLTFVNREKHKEHPGTQTQEVLRALIDRTMHCDNCLPTSVDSDIIYHLRVALALHEARALVRKTEKGYIEPERVIVSNHDGHFLLMQDSEQSEDSKYWIGRERNGRH